MATTDVSISNLAISHLGVTKQIANLETEKSEESRACRRFFTTARDKCLRDFSWPFASKIAALALIEEDPNDEWAYSYRYPSDCLEFKRILSGTRQDTRQSRVPYKISQDDAGLLIFSDQEDAEAEYTMRTDQPELYPPDFTVALSFLLAHYIAPSLTNGDPFKMGERALKMYLYEISRAQANAGNEEQPEEEPNAQMIRDRD